MAQLKTNPAANRNRKSWTSKDDAVLIQMVMANKQADEIAQLLGRTVNAVLCRKSALPATRKLKIRLKSTKGKTLLAPRCLSSKDPEKNFVPQNQTPNPEESAQEVINFDQVSETQFKEKFSPEPHEFENPQDGELKTIAEIARRTGTTITITFNGK